MASADTSSTHRPIRSFARREGRLTAGQQKALDTLWPIYGIDDPQSPDFSALLNSQRPLILEIGFGNGELLAHCAAALPEVNFLGIEVHRPGVGHLLLTLREKQLNNVRLLNHDAMEILANWIPPASLDAVWLFFPDPWPKKKHHKRRIVNPDFLDRLGRCLKPQGMLHMASDWQDYVESMQAILAQDARFTQATTPENAFEDSIWQRPQTKFERRGLRKGHNITDLRYRYLATAQAAMAHK